MKTRTLVHRISVIAASAAALFALNSCNDRPDISGTWTGTPSRMENIVGSSDADATISITFSAPDSKSETGDVVVSALIDGSQTEMTGDDTSYDLSVAATATVKGRWTYEEGEDDDLILALDLSSLQVQVDPDGVTFGNDVMTDSRTPMIDSLSAVAAARWQSSLTKAMSAKFSELQKISDIKIHKGGIMSCEISDRDFTFRKAN